MPGEPIGKCYKCGANLYATLGLCASCELVEVKAENEQLKEALKKYMPKVNEKICEGWAKCWEYDCPHRRPHKPIEDGGSKCILHTCRTMKKSGYKICVDKK